MVVLKSERGRGGRRADLPTFSLTKNKQYLYCFYQFNFFLACAARKISVLTLILMIFLYILMNLRGFDLDSENSPSI